MTKKQKQEQAEAIETLRGIFPVGSTLYTTVKHVARSGMSRRIACFASVDWRNGADVRNVSRLIARAIDARYHEGDGAVVVGGCGMDMGYHLMNCLSYALHGYPSDAPKCRKHRTQQDRPSVSGRACQKAGCYEAGYSLNHRWL